MITDEQWERMKREPTDVEAVEERSWWKPSVQPKIHMMSRWTGEQGHKDLMIPFWKKIVVGIMLKWRF